MPIRLYDIHINFKVHQQLDLCNTRFRVCPLHWYHFLKNFQSGHSIVKEGIIRLKL